MKVFRFKTSSGATVQVDIDHDFSVVVQEGVIACLHDKSKKVLVDFELLQMIAEFVDYSNLRVKIEGEKIRIQDAFSSIVDCDLHAYKVDRNFIRICIFLWHMTSAKFSDSLKYRFKKLCSAWR